MTAIPSVPDRPYQAMPDAELADEIEWTRLHLTSKRLDQRAKFREKYDALVAEESLRQTTPTG